MTTRYTTTNITEPSPEYNRTIKGKPGFAQVLSIEHGRLPCYYSMLGLSCSTISALLYLNLSRCDFSDDGCEKSSGLRNLKVLNLGFNDISDACLVQMRGIIDGVLCNNSQLYLGNGMDNSPTTGSVTTTVAEKQRLASLVLLSIIRKA
ncbi:unnamed protein product [Camellia sinensis]